jgi:hypothetical protein
MRQKLEEEAVLDSGYENVQVFTGEVFWLSNRMFQAI